MLTSLHVQGMEATLITMRKIACAFFPPEEQERLSRCMLMQSHMLHRECAKDKDRQP